MIRIIFWFAVLAAVTFAITWLADQPGSIDIEWLGYRIEDLPVGLAMLAVGVLFVSVWLLWSVFKWLIGRPGAFGGYFARRRERIGREALTRGLIAIGAGDDRSALQQARIAAKKLPGDPLAKLLEAQAALHQGDTAKVTGIYEQMTKIPETRLLGLRGLFNEARKAKNIPAARQYAEKALLENPGTGWATNAMLAAYSADGDWPAVLTTLENQKKAGTLDAGEFAKKKAVVLTAQALSLEDRDIEAAMDLAVEAHKLDPALVPAAVVAGRTLSAIGSLRKAARILEQTWRINPHPDIAEIYIHARAGDSVTDRLKRAKNLINSFHGGEEGAIALASAAIDAGDWKLARETLNPYIHERPRARICTLMAQIEDGEFGDKGRAREWLARAVRAPRDPAWTADGIVSPEWLPLSPVSGRLGVFEWKVPVEGLGYSEPGEEEKIISMLGGGDDAVDVPDEVHIKQMDDEAEVIEVSPGEDESGAGMGKEQPASSSDDAGKPEPEQAANKAHRDAKKTSRSPDEDKKPALIRQPDDPGPKKTNGAKPKAGWFD